jgi:hypothetical protein
MEVKLIIEVIFEGFKDIKVFFIFELVVEPVVMVEFV